MPYALAIAAAFGGILWWASGVKVRRTSQTEHLDDRRAGADDNAPGTHPTGYSGGGGWAGV